MTRTGDVVGVGMGFLALLGIVAIVISTFIADTRHYFRWMRVASWCRLVHNGYIGSEPHAVINPKIANILWRIL